MPKRSGGTKETIDKWIAAGHGQGEGENYRPFLIVRDVPSSGRSRKIKSLKNGRTQHYLSDLEYYHHILHEYDPNVIDIREQFALIPLYETQEIAQQLSIKHPIYKKFLTPIVMTSDLVVTIQSEAEEIIEVISVKPSSEVDVNNPKSERTFEKLLIEKIYWENKGISWRLSTENDISMNRALNLDMLRYTLFMSELDFLNKKMEMFIAVFNKYWKPYFSLNEILKKTTLLLGLEINQSFCLFGRAIWSSLLPVDLDTELIGHGFPLKRLL